MSDDFCRLCGKLWRPKMRYTRKGIETVVYAHRAADGQIHSVSHSQPNPGAPDTPLPPARGIALALASADHRDGGVK